MENKKYELEDEIRELIYDDNKNSAHFEYGPYDYVDVNNGNVSNGASIKLITLNKKTGASFLLTSADGKTTVRALLRIKQFLTDEIVQSALQTFTLKWYVKGQKQSRPNKSKFTAYSIEEAVSKFYHGKNKKSLEIYSISNDSIKSKDYEG